MNSRSKLWKTFIAADIFLLIGALGYMYIEQYPFIDALYMAVITISTVGFGEIHPLSETGRLFTIFYILSGVGCLAYAVSSVTEFFIERATDPNLWKKPMEKKISRLKDHTIICGFGRVGSIAAHQLKKANNPFVVIENDNNNHLTLQELRYLHIEGDATRESVLLKAGIKRAGSLLAMLDSDPENLFTVLTARELNPTLQIIARCENFTSEKRILRAGADTIVSPHVSAGNRVAEAVLTHSGKTPAPEIVPAHSPLVPVWLDLEKEINPITEAEKFLGVKIIGFRINDIDTMDPPPEAIIPENAHLLCLCSAEKEDAYHSRTKLLLIDDNPVICRLYTRLFQKEGFSVLIAATGEEGIDIVHRETPEIVVIDYHLPDISGLEATSRIRAIDKSGKIKIVLFTGDDTETTRNPAMFRAVDAVVIKSSNTNEVISQVKEILLSNSSKSSTKQ